MTFSAVARCKETGMMGVVVTSSSPAVAARCAFAEAGVGAVSTQNITDPSLGPRALKLINANADALEAIETLQHSAPDMEFRQILLIDKHGDTACHTGSGALGLWAENAGKNIAAAGNLLGDVGVPRAMVAKFEESENTGEHLADRLMDVLQAGLDAGGEAGPLRSAGIMVVDRLSWPLVDLRIDWTEGAPISELADLWAIYKPQMDDYVTRAIAPGDAPSYGVPGDE
jgi:uncharacterized Ntn-hydrolase superfamily protein